MGSSRVWALAPNPCPGRLLHSSAAAVTRSGHPVEERAGVVAGDVHQKVAGCVVDVVQ